MFCQDTLDSNNNNTMLFMLMRVGGLYLKSSQLILKKLTKKSFNEAMDTHFYTPVLELDRVHKENMVIKCVCYISCEL